MDDPRTPLDAVADGVNSGDDAKRLAFFDRFAASELYLLLEAEAEGGRIRPRIFPTAEATLVLAFDLEERLSAFAGGAAPYAALSGRALAEMLSGQGLGVALNLGSAFETVLDATALGWLDTTLQDRPAEVEAHPEEVSAPAGLPEALLTALDARLSGAAGLAAMAYLVAVRYRGGVNSHLMAFIDPVPDAEPSLARAVGEALTFSGLEAGVLDVGFFRASDPVCAKLAKSGLRFDLPEPESGTLEAVPPPPGSDPDTPPRLR